MLKKIEKFNRLDDFLNKKPQRVLERNCLVDVGLPTQEKKMRELGDKGYMVASQKVRSANRAGSLGQNQRKAQKNFMHANVLRVKRDSNPKIDQF